jgi:ubiquinone/menaquinone biosynthesis C-methylase UbiE
VSHDRDVAAFDRRADSYEQGWLGAWHQRLAEQVARRVAVADSPPAHRVLDVGCGTGVLLGWLSRLLPGTAQLYGIDPAPRMVAAAGAALEAEPRVCVATGVVERLPFPDTQFDLVVTTLSFDHWADQQRGLVECARVLKPGGRLVLVDLLSPVLWPTTVVGRRGRARTPRQLRRLLDSAGLRRLATHRLYPLIKMVTVQR